MSPESFYSLERSLIWRTIKTYRLPQNLLYVFPEENPP